MLMVCKQTGCAVDVREDLVERFKSAGYTLFDEPREEPAPEPEQPKKPRKAKAKPKAG